MAWDPIPSTFNGQQYGEGQGIEHEQNPGNVIDGIVSGDVFEQIVHGVEHGGLAPFTILGAVSITEKLGG